MIQSPYALFLLLALLLQAGCGEAPSSEGGHVSSVAGYSASPVITVDLPKQPLYRLAEVMQIEQVVRLETSPKAMLSGVSHVYQLPDGQWLGADPRSAQIKVFDSTGAYRYDIGAVGKGPGEWLSLEAVDYDPTTDRLMAFSDRDMRLNLYRSDGNLLKSTTLGFFANQLLMLPGHGWGALTGFNISERSGAHHFLVTNEELEIENRFLPFDDQEERATMRGAGFLYRRPTGCLLMPPFGDTVFHWQAGQLTPAYVLDFGDRTMPVDKRGAVGLFQSGQYREYGRQSGRAWETKAHFVFCVSWKRRLRVRVWDRQRQRLWGYELCDAPLAAETLFRPVGLTSSGAWILALLPGKWNPDWHKPGTWRAKAAAESRAYLQTHYPQVFDQLQQMTEDDNYALLCVRLTLPGTE